jgi:NAD(P)H dehydrogenase (quinone)
MRWAITMRVLVLYDSHSGQVARLAQAVAEGVRRVEGAAAVLRDIPRASRQDLLNADAIALGSPNWSGITGAMKAWLDEQGDLWEEGALSGKPGAAFTAGRGRSSGAEFTLLGLLHWMLACGMIIVGLPWSDLMRQSGSYYGATATGDVQDADLVQARNLGQRLATVALRLAQPAH